MPWQFFQFQLIIAEIGTHNRIRLNEIRRKSTHMRIWSRNHYRISIANLDKIGRSILFAHRTEQMLRTTCRKKKKIFINLMDEWDELEHNDVSPNWRLLLLI